MSKYIHYISNNNTIADTCGEMLTTKYDISQPKYKACTVSISINPYYLPAKCVENPIFCRYTKEVKYRHGLKIILYCI